MNRMEQLRALAQWESSVQPVVSVYLNTQWDDEHQRDRVRVFVRQKLAEAKVNSSGVEWRAVEADLARVQQAVEDIVNQRAAKGAKGVAFFVCGARDLFLTLPFSAPFANQFAVRPRPVLRPLATALAEWEPILVVMVDAGSARLIPLATEGIGDVLTIESEVPGKHKKGGWFGLADRRMERHIQDHLDRHLKETAEAISALVARHGIDGVVLSGLPKRLVNLQQFMPEEIKRRVIGSMPVEMFADTASAAEQAWALFRERSAHQRAAALVEVLTMAAKPGGRAAAGLQAVLEAVNRKAVHRLYLSGDFRHAGWRCGGCGSLGAGAAERCSLCNVPVESVELGEEFVTATLREGGRVEPVVPTVELVRVEGVAALLRFS